MAEGSGWHQRSRAASAGRSQWRPKSAGDPGRLDGEKESIRAVVRDAAAWLARSAQARGCGSKRTGGAAGAECEFACRAEDPCARKLAGCAKSAETG